MSTYEESKIQNHFAFKKKEGVTVRYKCLQCDEHFHEINDLKNHVSSNHQQFSQKRLINNIESKHEGNIYKYDCNQCDLKFTNQNHIKSKHRVKHNCNQCGLKFASKDYLKSHIQSIHDNVRYNCNQCDLHWRN